ncbi:hypothetical protein CBR64_15225 [Cellulosimicrobium cellulans]|uniref:Shikimate kinase n=1 Tax=Cellulosimicrobium cellulans TaxID=1710 RepID=A0A1Y0HZ76_CELCE|nr:hypothetical protein [Cellulosimicrobium cellulans]ARU52605.1 hypothetical protein CBR64_15225 [Cellulosimicrobium cellulans]
MSQHQVDGRAVAPVLVLLGPGATGKSTLGGLVAGLLGVAFVDLDAVADRYYPDVGWSVDRLVERIAVVGRVAAEREWEPARAHAVERAVADHPGAVLALGAGHASYTDPACLDRVRAALAPVPHVVLVLPRRRPRARPDGAAGAVGRGEGHGLGP